MNLNPFKRPYWVIAIVLAGCARASVSQQSQSVPISNDRPTQIAVYPVAVDASEVTLNQSIFQRAYRSVSHENESEHQLKIAHETAHDVCDQIAADLKQKGYQALCQERGTAVNGSNVMIVDGQFTNISEGNRLRRLVIGFGAALPGTRRRRESLSENRAGHPPDFAVHHTRRQWQDARSGRDGWGRGGSRWINRDDSRRQYRHGRREDPHLCHKLPDRKDLRANRSNRHAILYSTRLGFLISCNPNAALTGPQPSPNGERLIIETATAFA